MTMSVEFLKSLLDAGSLGPDELGIASDAYQDALRLIGDAGADPDIRASLARHVIQSVLNGDRDTNAIRDAAIHTMAGVDDAQMRFA